nr:TrmH family RNA methyltransferase [Bacteroides intestinalis]
MPIIEISSLSHPGIEVFSTLTEAQLRNRIEPDKGLFIAESPKVIRVALDAGYEPLALLCEQKHITGDAADIISRCGDVPVYTGGRELLATLTGSDLARHGFRTAAMALTDNSISIADPVLTSEPRLAIVMGTEGEGLPPDTIAAADYVVRIPMAHGVDSLNVAVAAAVAFWQLRIMD